MQGIVFTIQHPKSMTRHFTTDSSYAMLKRDQGFIIFARRYKVI